MAKIMLSAFADEASPMLDEQIQALKEEGITPAGVEFVENWSLRIR